MCEFCGICGTCCVCGTDQGPEAEPCEACGGDGIACEANYDGEGAAEEPCAFFQSEEAAP